MWRQCLAVCLEMSLGGGREKKGCQVLLQLQLPAPQEGEKIFLFWCAVQRQMIVKRKTTRK